MLEGSEEMEGVNPTQETNSDLGADNSSWTTTQTDVSGLAPTEGGANGVKLSNEASEGKIFDDVKQNINTVYFVLKEDLELLASKRDKFMLMSQKINDVHFSDVITLNVGGHSFQTSLRNIRKYPESTLAAMFSEKFDLAKGDDGAYFIDRDGTHFRHILNFLRLGMGPHENLLGAGATGELIREAEFYGLGRLVEIIKEPNKELIEEDGSQNKAIESECPNKDDLETKINQHYEQTKAIFDEIRLKLEKGHSALQRSLANLQEHKEEYLEMTKKIDTAHFPEVVKLNIGGQIFETNIKTLQKDPNSLLATMFSKQIEVIKQENEAYFIDRNGALFEHVLNYLRTGKIPQKVIEDLGEELLEEAIFYNIKGMVESITVNNKRVKINIGGSSFETTTETLNKHPCSKLAQMLGMENRILCIDRDGTHFRHVLNYLRTGNLPTKVIQDFGEELLEEALFYNLEGMVNCIKRVKIKVDGSSFETSVDTLMKYPNSKLAQMLHKEVDGVDYFDGTYYMRHSSQHFGDLLKAMEIEDISDLSTIVASKVLNEAYFYEVNFFQKYASGGLFLTKILQNHKSHQKQLLEWLKKEDQPNSIQLIYAAELDGWDATDFHRSCDGISPTLVLMESTDGGIFGGYTTKPWSSKDMRVMDEDFFIFKLAVKPSETTFKMKLDNGLIRTAESYGPCFGSAQETNVHCVVLIDSEPNRNMCACMGFENHTTAEGVTVSRKTLAGDEQFLLTKMEVFQIE